MPRAAFALLLAAPLLAQQSDLRFEAATLKPSKSDQPGGGIRPAPGGQRYIATNIPIKLMIQVAYRLKSDQILGAPSWLENDRYDMAAVAEKPSTPDELHTMLINLLVDRLHLKFHQEKKEMRMYALTVDKDGPKLTPHQSSNAGQTWIEPRQAPFLHMHLKATSAPMAYFAFNLSQFLDLPVVDMTNLPGEYDFTLDYTRDLPPGFPEGGKINGEDPDTSGPTIFTALKQQLGLQLKAQRGPVGVIVIDHVEKPTEN